MTRTRLDVCLATLRFHPVYAGPAVRFRRYAPGLRARGVDMRVFTATPDDDLGKHGDSTDARSSEGGWKNGTLLPLEYVDEIPVQRVQTPRSDRLIRQNWVYARALARYCRPTGNRPDLVQFLSLPQFSLPWLLRLHHWRIPLVFTHTLMGGMSGRTLKRDLIRLHWRRHFNVMDCVVVSSNVMQRALRDLGIATRIEVIPNGVDLGRFRPIDSPSTRTLVRRQLGLDSEAEIALFVGPIEARKGVDVLVQAWSLLARKRPKAILVLVGPHHNERGASRPGQAGFQTRIEGIVRESGAAERVVFTGAVDNVEAYYRVADLFVFPSIREGMPNVVPEAFACGVPSILTPFIGLPDDFGRPGEQYLLVERTPEALATAIQALLDDDEERKRLASRARTWAEEHMDVEHSLDQYAALYSELVDSSGRMESRTC